MTSQKPMGWMRRAFYRLSWLFGRVLFRFYFRLEVEGLPKPFPKGPLIVAANHCSYLDPPVLAAAIPRRIAFLVTSMVYYRRRMRPLMWLYGCLPVEEQKPNLRTIKAALRRLSLGEVIGIFPEGGIGDSGRLERGRPGVAALLKKGHAPVLPVSLIGTQRSYPRHGRFPRPIKLVARCGPILFPDQIVKPGMSAVEARQAILQRLMTEIAAGLPDEQKPTGELVETEREEPRGVLRGRP